MTRPVASIFTFFTYTLGKSLYVPLTSRSNTCTLPETRGPKFMLPPEVVRSLCRVRDAEHQTEQWETWLRSFDIRNGNQKLPPAQDYVASLFDDGHPTISENTADLDLEEEDGRHPTVEELMREVQQMLKSTTYDSVVIAGEGEPLLRWKALVQLTKRMNQSDPNMPLRLTTNGLTWRERAAETLRASGITSVSVALMTYDPDQYDQLMKPVLLSPYSPQPKPHAVVCKFIQSALHVGLTVEVTGVTRDDVDKTATEDLALRLGVKEPFRWRPYFP